MADAQFGAKTQNNGFKNDGNITDNLIGDLAKQVAKQSEKIKSLKDENANLRDRTTRAETQLQAIATAQTARCHAVSSQQQYVGNLDRSYSLKSDASDQKVAAVSNRVIAVEDSVEAHEKKLTSSLERLGDAHHGTEEELKKVIGDVKFNSRCIDDEIIKTDSLTIEHKGVADKLAKFEKERHEFGLQQLACNESMMAGNTKLGKTFTDGLKKVKEDHEKDIAQVKEDMNTLKSELNGDVHTLKCSTATGIQKMNDTMVEDAKSHVSLRRKVDTIEFNADESIRRLGRDITILKAKIDHNEGTVATSATASSSRPAATNGVKSTIGLEWPWSSDEEGDQVKFAKAPKHSLRGGRGGRGRGAPVATRRWTPRESSNKAS